MEEKLILDILTITENSKLYPNQRKIIVDRLKEIASDFVTLENENNQLKGRLTGKVDYPIYLEKLISILSLLGFDRTKIDGMSSEFINWFSNAIVEQKYEGRLMNFYLLVSWYYSFMTASVIYERDPTYIEVKEILLDKSQSDEKIKVEFIEKMMNLVISDEPAELRREKYRKMISK